jgi:hypothetical protein
MSGGSEWKQILIQSLISAAAEGLLEMLARIKSEDRDPTLPRRNLTDEESRDVEARALLLVDRLREARTLNKSKSEN